jgi:poly-beta-1,6-N-acetyl-D-glucosamine biosynthesis protein PgaD
MAKSLRDSTIHFRQFLTARQRAREAIITTALWFLYGYLWLPLVSFAAWYFGIDFAYERVIRAGGPDQLILLLLWFSIIFLIILLIVVTWSGVQYSRFTGDGERRNRAPLLDPADERELWQIDTPLQQHIKTGQVLTVSMDTDLRNLSVREGFSPKTAIEG